MSDTAKDSITKIVKILPPIPDLHVEPKCYIRDQFSEFTAFCLYTAEVANLLYKKPFIYAEVQISGDVVKIMKVLDNLDWPL